MRVKLEEAHAALAPLQAEVVAAQSRNDVAAAEKQLLEGKHAEGKAALQGAKVAKMEAEGAITSKEVQIQHMEVCAQRRPGSPPSVAATHTCVVQRMLRAEAEPRTPNPTGPRAPRGQTATALNERNRPAF